MAPAGGESLLAWVRGEVLARSGEEAEAHWQIGRNLLLQLALSARFPEHAATLDQAVDLLESRLAARLSCDRRPLPEHAASTWRVVLMVGCLPADAARNSHLRQVCSYAAALALCEAIAAVDVVVTHEAMLEAGSASTRGLSPAHERLFRLDQPIEGWHAEWQAALCAFSELAPIEKISIRAVPFEGILAPYRALLAVMDGLRPEALVEFLGVTRARLAPRLLFAQMPVLSVQLHPTNPEPVFCDLVLAQEDSRRFATRPRPAIWRSHVIPLVPFPRRETLAEAAVRGPEQTLIVSALTYGRLERALALNGFALLTRIAAFLRQHPGTAWLFVGVEQAAGLERTDARWADLVCAGRLRWRGFESDLRALYQHCDIYAHLPECGGGGMGIAMAVAEGVPAIAGDEGGDDLLADEFRYRDTDEFFAHLARLLAHPDRTSLAAAQMTRIEARHSLAGAAASLGALVEEARARARSR